MKAQPSKIPAEQAAHGPYPNMPDAELQHYLADRALLGFPLNQMEEQYIRDRESESQYNQHMQVMEEMAEVGKIDDRAYNWLEKNLSRWFIGMRNPGEYEIIEDTVRPDSSAG